jgi:uncharacterized membrane protein HdeD (DUF308 family)
MKTKTWGITRYMPGVILVLLGLVIVAFPMLLVAFVSALLILGGIMAIALAYKIKRFEDGAGRLHDSASFHRSFWNHAERVFHHNRWHA